MLLYLVLKELDAIEELLHFLLMERVLVSFVVEAQARVWHPIRLVPYLVLFFKHFQLAFDKVSCFNLGLIILQWEERLWLTFESYLFNLLLGYFFCRLLYCYLEYNLTVW